MRAKRLLDQPIEFIYHASFETPNVGAEILGAPPKVAEKQGTFRAPPGFTVGPVTFSAKDHIGAESLRLLQADSTGNFKAITGAQRSAIFPLVHPLK